MALKKISICEKHIELVISLLAKNKSSYYIAKKIGVSQPTLWRNLEFLGLNKKRKKNNPKKNGKEKVKHFTFDDYKEKNVII